MHSNIADGKHFFFIAHSFFVVCASLPFLIQFYFASFIVFGKFYFFYRVSFCILAHIGMQRDITEFIKVEKKTNTKYRIFQYIVHGEAGFFLPQNKSELMNF